ncbi:N-acetylmuramoyl-L-alanine amidase-like domain-containing protein [Parabacteroides bouchesdurhonensis]|uniref:N-acetylmuramoyl-L-alanine amidase-like domain-containing protein n=1 Tax=Parabacteroides bouchesdurhonensis TaxID=1936995 RepID=UPI000C8673C7|nr:N-acetylmuramoyl-L-alanine amidase-like domain-containing protein [Parabacteroides bouchesdurhonensis]
MTFRYYCLVILLSVSLVGKVFAVSAKDTIYCTNEDKAIFERCLERMIPKKSLPVGDLMVETARSFLGVPYVAATLEQIPEALVVNFRGLDCMTLVESTSAFVRTLQSESPTFAEYCYYLRSARYRNGKIEDYTDRLHYTTDWIYENQQAGWIKDVTKEIGGEPLDINLSFMSTHPGSYPQLKDSPERIAIIAEKEKEINKRSYYYLPEDKIGVCVDGIKNGDIICFVTNIKGLDISHVGIACRVGSKLTFIHASSTAKKVIVSEESLESYTKRIKGNIGIMVLRLSDHH